MPPIPSGITGWKVTSPMASSLAATTSILEKYRIVMPDRAIPMIKKRGKKGFGIPIAKWLCGELKGLMLETLSEGRLKRQGIFKPSVVRKLVSDHLAHRVDNRKKLWNLLIFQLS